MQPSIPVSEVVGVQLSLCTLQLSIDLWCLETAAGARPGATKLWRVGLLSYLGHLARGGKLAAKLAFDVAHVVHGEVEQEAAHGGNSVLWTLVTHL